MFSNLWLYVRQLWQQQSVWVNLASIFTVIAAVYGFLHVSGQGIRALVRFVNREKLHHRLKPYFNREEIMGAIKNYVPTRCQNVDPATAAEPRRVIAFAASEKLIPFFIKQVFREKKEEKYYLVLADSGMGKTTFMVNLFLKYSRKWFKTCDIVLVPLGHPKADEKIESVQDKPRTILLLDAFDEDVKAARNFKVRMQELIDKTLDFQAIIITCRSHFFPSDPDIPDETGVYKFGGNKGEHRFYRIYVSPFSQSDIRRYLRGKFPLYLWFKRSRARTIVDRSPDLMVRPMLLANIDDLLKKRREYRYSYEIYEEMVERWIQRERVKDKDELRTFSRIIARDMYQNQHIRGGLFIPHDQMGAFAQAYNIRLDELEMRSRSLLNRNAEGKYKFAHKSILEYLLSLELVQDIKFRNSFNYENMDQARKFCNDQITRLDLAGNHITDMTPLRDLVNIRSLNLSDNEINDVTPLRELRNISRLDLSGNQITDVTLLRELRNISRLDLSGNQITDLTPLRELRNISRLDLSGNQIADLTPLRELKKIKYLTLTGNRITDVTPLRELKNIEALYLSRNRITDLTPLRELKRIKYLTLTGNRITDVTPLRELKNIGHLNLSGNQITDLTPLKELTHLFYLNVENNPIKDKSAIEELRRRLRENLKI
ncbi:MAG: leucine-rich repeat domain-containing protein [Candidatus Omnitrophota bacterium]